MPEESCGVGGIECAADASIPSRRHHQPFASSPQNLDGLEGKPSRLRREGLFAGSLPGSKPLLTISPHPAWSDEGLLIDTSSHSFHNKSINQLFSIETNPWPFGRPDRSDAFWLYIYATFALYNKILPYPATASLLRHFSNSWRARSVSV
jgi:hypothetical protein